MDYSILNFEEGDDLNKVLEKGKGDFKKSSGMTEPSIDSADEDKKSRMYVFQKKLNMFTKREQ